jgi:hypothetical protein
LPATAIAFIGDIPASFNILRNIGSGILSVGNNTLELDAFAFFGGMAVSAVDAVPGVVAKVEGATSHLPYRSMYEEVTSIDSNYRPQSQSKLDT